MNRNKFLLFSLLFCFLSCDSKGVIRVYKFENETLKEIEIYKGIHFASYAYCTGDDCGYNKDDYCFVIDLPKEKPDYFRKVTYSEKWQLYVGNIKYDVRSLKNCEVEIFSWARVKEYRGIVGLNPKLKDLDANFDINFETK
jgi:hypothetical protein